nr:reverse transcriptase domain-containing protein [Tanacetum cinerariifolium]
MFAYSNDSRRRSYYSSRRDTESCYQSSRSRGPESVPKKNNSKKESSRKTEALSGGEDSVGGHSKSRSKRQKSGVEEYDLPQPWAAAKMERWAMPTWCHMFNSTLTKNARLWFEDLPKESIDSYDDLKKAFLENYLQQKKCIKDPVEIHNIKQRDRESMEEFVRRYKPECRDQEAGPKQNFKKGSFWNQQRSERKQDRFTILTKTPKEILALDKEKFKPPPPMTNPVEKRNASKFCEFHREVRHTTDKCMNLKRKDQAKAAKNRGNLRKRQATGNPDGTVMAEGNQTKDYPNLLSGDGDLISSLRGGGWGRRSYDHRGRDGGTLCPSYVCARRLLLRNPKPADMTGVPLRRQAPESNVTKIDLGGLVIADSKLLGHIPWKIRQIGKGTFLGYNVNADGLKVCPDKVEAVLSLPKIITILQNFKEMHKKIDFQWTAKAKTAFKQMKKLIAELPMLTVPKEKEELIIYLAAAKEAISAVLMTKRNGKQMPIYFVSRALQGPEINYTPMEKLILALVSASKRLKRYLQAHTILVITDQLIKQILSNPEVAGRLIKWSFELEEHDIHYRSRTSVKGKILIDFIVERPEDDSSDTPMTDKKELPDPWILFTDGSSCIDATNNEAKYEALIVGLRIAEQMGIKNLQALVDSRLVANQVNESYIEKEPGMIKYLEKVRTLTNVFKEFSIKQISRAENKKAYALIEEEGHTWITLIYEYLTKELLPKEKNKARAIRRKAGRYAVTNGVLHKKSFLGPCLRCVGPLQANYVLREIHERSCNMHAGPRSVVAKALRSGYYWLTVHADAMKLIKECNDYQHSQANGLKERANRILGKGIKARLDERSKNLLEEISHVLWAHRTIIKSSNGETPFSLTYGTEAVISIEIGMPTLKIAKVDMIKNNEALEINLDLLEEKKEHTAI